MDQVDDLVVDVFQLTDGLAQLDLSRLIPRLYLCCGHKNCARSGGAIGGVKLMVCDECCDELRKRIEAVNDPTWSFPVTRKGGN